MPKLKTLIIKLKRIRMGFEYFKHTTQYRLPVCIESSENVQLQHCFSRKSYFKMRGSTMGAPWRICKLPPATPT